MAGCFDGISDDVCSCVSRLVNGESMRSELTAWLPMRNRAQRLCYLFPEGLANRGDAGGGFGDEDHEKARLVRVLKERLAVMHGDRGTRAADL